MTKTPLDGSFNRRKFIKSSGIVVAGAAAVGAGLSWTVPARASTMPAIPEKSIKWATMPFTNHAWMVLAGRKGYLKDVGISTEPRDPKMVLERHTIPQLQNGGIDISTAYVGLITAALDKLPDIKPFHVYSFWAGNAILTAPDSGIKTIDEFIAEGLPWKEASHKTMMQLKGKQIAVPPNPSTYPWMNLAYSFAGLKMEDSQVVRLDDPKAVQLALSGRIPLAAPGGAVQIYQLQYQAGWKPVMSTNQMVKFVPTGTGSEVNNVLNYDLILTTEKYLQENRETILRFSGATYRTLEYIFGPDQRKALAEYAPFINTAAGSDLDVDAIKYIFDVVDPFYRWEDQEKIWMDRSYNLNYLNVYEYQIDKYKKAGTIADRDYDLDEFFRAKGIWMEMRDLKKKAEGLIAKGKQENLSADRKKLIDLAEQHHGWYNFLDAVRFAEAAFA